MRTPEETQKQIDGLESMKKWLPEFSFFGDNNWKTIDDQISILKGDNDADSLAEEYDEEEKDSSPLFDVEYWMDGSSDNDLFEEQ